MWVLSACLLTVMQALRLAFAMSVLFFMALFLPVLAPRASSQASLVIATHTVNANMPAVQRDQDVPTAASDRIADKIASL